MTLKEFQDALQTTGQRDLVGGRPDVSLVYFDRDRFLVMAQFDFTVDPPVCVWLETHHDDLSAEARKAQRLERIKQMFSDVKASNKVTQGIGEELAEPK